MLSEWQKNVDTFLRSFPAMISSVGFQSIFLSRKSA